MVSLSRCGSCSREMGRFLDVIWCDLNGAQDKRLGVPTKLGKNAAFQDT